MVSEGVFFFYCLFTHGLSHMLHYGIVQVSMWWCGATITWKSSLWASKSDYIWVNRRNKKKGSLWVSEHVYRIGNAHGMSEFMMIYISPDFYSVDYSFFFGIRWLHSSHDGHTLAMNFGAIFFFIDKSQFIPFLIKVSFFLTCPQVAQICFSLIISIQQWLKKRFAYFRWLKEKIIYRKS